MIKAWFRIVAMSLVLLASPAKAQELEYALELGGMLGGSFYLGDANYHAFFKNLHPAGGLVGRYNFNPRRSLKFNIAATQISGNAQKISYKYPDIPEQQWEFKHMLWDVGAQFEVGFWGYGTGGGYKGNRKLCPYIQFGLGATVCNKAFTLNIPVGVGVKYKFKPRWNVGIDWTMRFAMSDNLDGIKDPYRIESGFMKNKDNYSFTMIYITYDLCPKYRKCNNE